MLRSNNEDENELWNQTYYELRTEKEDLLEQLSRIDKADDDFYRQSDLILNFCKKASSIFIKSSPSEKRTICEIIGSNFTVNGQKVTISLHPVFYDIIEMNRLGHSENGMFELTETQSGQQKRASKKALDLNGGNDEARLEIFALNESTDFLFRNFVSSKEKSSALCKNFAELGQV